MDFFNENIFLKFGRIGPKWAQNGLITMFAKYSHKIWGKNEADLVTFIEDIFHGKLQFLCSEIHDYGL